MARLNYVELPARDVRAAKAFYEQAFGWSLAEFGPTYAATVSGDTDIGLQGDPVEATRAPLAVIDVPDLEAALKSVVDAGGTIARPIFAFPGGRRFQFLDPNGNELAAVEATASKFRAASNPGARAECHSDLSCFSTTSPPVTPAKAGVSGRNYTRPNLAEIPAFAGMTGLGTQGGCRHIVFPGSWPVAPAGTLPRCMRLLSIWMR